MKDGRPSLINDIRFFFGSRHTYLKEHEDAVAFGRRIAWLLNAEGFSLGSYPALYIFLTPTLPPGTVQVTDYGGDWWQRYTNVGVPPEFPNVPESSQIVMRGTVDALKAIRPDLATMIEQATKAVQAEGNELRFLIKSRETKRYLVEVSFNISAWPAPSFLFVTLTDKSTGEYLEAPPTPLPLYSDAFDLAGSVRIDATRAEIAPNESIAAGLTSLRHGGAIARSINEFVAIKYRPTISKRVKPRGF